MGKVTTAPLPVERSEDIVFSNGLAAMGKVTIAPLPVERSEDIVFSNGLGAMGKVTIAPLPVERGEDIVFGELVTKILTSLPEGVEKDELKMDIQSRMLQTRVRIQRQKQHYT